MSLETWLTEFYPIRADMCSKDNELEHARSKWTGVLKKNLTKHGVTLCRETEMFQWSVWGSGDEFYLDSRTCACCINHYCRTCPLNRCGEIYEHFQDTGDPRPMIAHINAAIEQQKQNQTKGNKP